jgi:hypothetical protein
VIKASDGKLSGSLALDAPTTTTDSAPTITGALLTCATIGEPCSFKPTTSDLEGDALTFSIVNKPAWASRPGFGPSDSLHSMHPNRLDQIVLHLHFRQTTRGPASNIQHKTISETTRRSLVVRLGRDGDTARCSLRANPSKDGDAKPPVLAVSWRHG